MEEANYPYYSKEFKKSSWKDNPYVSAAVLLSSLACMSAGIFASKSDPGIGYAVASSSAVPIILLFGEREDK